ncbi:lipopolysaccharide assembly protein LapA domain-containing protein [Streptococcus sp. ZJ93]|uniref:lipopolysaccharide assembly protein LapA domain-containing protein n=1 Tax=Streptococcus handemini TaxID=3161188 RepID=UPI0032EDEF3C
MKTKLYYIIVLLLILLIASLSLANMETVKVSYLFGTFQLPLIILILISVLLGAIIASLLSMGKHFSIRGELKQTKKELANQNQAFDEKIKQVNLTENQLE